jgi:hypothetical protein
MNLTSLCKRLVRGGPSAHAMHTMLHQYHGNASFDGQDIVYQHVLADFFHWISSYI